MLEHEKITTDLDGSGLTRKYWQWGNWAFWAGKIVNCVCGLVCVVVVERMEERIRRREDEYLYDFGVPAISPEIGHEQKG